MKNRRLEHALAEWRHRLREREHHMLTWTRARRNGVVAAIIAVIVVVGGTVGGLAVSSDPPGSHAKVGAGSTKSKLPDVAPPTKVCGLSSLVGPSVAPANAIIVPPGNNSIMSLGTPDTTYYFESGTHTIGSSEFSQIDPGDNGTYIGAPGAVLSGDLVNDGAFEGTATGVTIEYLTIKDFIPPGSEGAVNHDSGEGWTIEHDTIEDNSPGAGLMIGTNNKVSENCLTHNGEYGFDAYVTASAPSASSLTGGPRNITLTDNEISDNDTYNWESKQPGCGCSGGGKFWRVDGATVTGNYVHDNLNVGLWVDTNNTGFDISGNTLTGNWNSGLIYELSYNATISNNVFTDNAWGEGPTNPSFPTGAIYISESGGDAQVPGYSAGALAISGNSFINNWAGVVLWENSNRFCGAGNGTVADGLCTLGDPPVANVGTCTKANLQDAVADGSPDYFDLCRWKTQNVTVSGDAFDFSEASIPLCKGTANGCGENGIFSEFGTDPNWSPYRGTVIETDITTKQNNHFSDNTYIGPWSFVFGQQSVVLSPTKWHSEGQDVSSKTT